jgi:hypothetical protein
LDADGVRSSGPYFGLRSRACIERQPCESSVALLAPNAARFSRQHVVMYRRDAGIFCGEYGHAFGRVRWFTHRFGFRVTLSVTGSFTPLVPCLSFTGDIRPGFADLRVRP